MPERIVVNFKRGEVRREPEPPRDLITTLMRRVLRRRRRAFVLTGGSTPAPEATPRRR